MFAEVLIYKKMQYCGNTYVKMLHFYLHVMWTVAGASSMF